MAKEYIKGEALAKVVDVPVQTVWAMARQKRIPFIKIGRAYRFNAEEVIAALAANGQEAVEK